jgi:hypothetical protein
MEEEEEEEEEEVMQSCPISIHLPFPWVSSLFKPFNLTQLRDSVGCNTFVTC